ncbi:MAG: thiazole biosynthesis adenylyltransferase ThiF [Planctomycetes bacterium]|nr:thiazole biosynthesis adenylyltransferase ThiF [Planctomycetota bacterium]
MASDLERYSRQILFSEIGEEGQRRLLAGRVLLCGCGALGSVIADTLTRAGVGFLRIVDRDFVELSNLQRQILFDEEDVESHLPKAVAAAEKLQRINRDVTIEPVVADIDHTNILDLCDRVDLILDGTDNFEVRFLINDASLERSIPWVYGGCIGSHGQTMTIFPGKTACLRCLIDSVPEPGTTETCDTAGILGPTVNVIASLQCIAALKILSGRPDAVSPHLTIIDLWDGSYRRMSVKDLRDRADCPACKRGDRSWLSGQHTSQSTVLCGRNAVQIAPQQKAELDLSALAAKLQAAGTVETNPYLLRLRLNEPDVEVTVFRDGRAIIKGTQDPAVAKTVYSRYIGL